MTKEMISAIILILFVLAFFMLVFILEQKTLNIKSKTVGDGQHGTARFATDKEIKETYKHIKYEPKKWRLNAPKDMPQGIIVGANYGATVTALVDDQDVHALMIGSAGVGKTAKFLYPNIEYACASGMSFIATDTKGDVPRYYGYIAKEYYGYNISVLDLRNPTKSDGFNMLYLVNRYIDKYLKNGDLRDKAKAEKYAKIIGKTVIYSGGLEEGGAGQNSYFYEASEGILTSAILIIAEFCSPYKNNESDINEQDVKIERHIVSVFKLIQELLEPSEEKGKTEFKILLEKLPETHKARWFAGSAISTSEQSMQSVLSTALSKLNAFLDSELEQMICFDTTIDAEKFCNEKSAIFLVMPEEDNSKYFLISLIIQQLYREMLTVADENGGKLKNRVIMYLDEFGTLPKIESADMMFSASRSRKISIVAIIQSLAQLEKNYGKEGAEIIIDNCQLSIFGGFAPNSETATKLSKNLGEKTVMTGSTSKGKDKSQSLQMMGRALITPDELKSLQRDIFVIMKTGVYPMKSRLLLFFKWGISLDKEFEMENTDIREIHYADKRKITNAIEKDNYLRRSREFEQMVGVYDEIDDNQDTETDVLSELESTNFSEDSELAEKTEIQAKRRKKAVIKDIKTISKNMKT